MNRGLAPLAAAAAAVAFGAGCATAPVVSGPIEVPKVFQRAPGWCAPASLSRCLLMEGYDVDQADLAARGGCTPDGGVDFSAFCRSLRVFLALRGLELVPTFETDAASAMALADRYDLEAALSGKPPLGRIGAMQGGNLILENLFAGAQAEEMRRATRGRVPAFRRAVRRAVSSGRPALWGVVLGIVPESGPSIKFFSGGHVRLLTGVDFERDVVFYSDPWGPDCATKTMPVADACAMTMSLWTLRKRHGPVVLPAFHATAKDNAKK